MKRLILGALACAFLATPAFAGDPLTTLQTVTLNDVKQAEAIYAANPTVPTYEAATTCLGWLDATITNAGGANPLGNLSAPIGVASGVADLDVALNGANAGVPKIVYDFNANCGGYIEDLKAQAVQITAKQGLGVVLPFGIKF